MRKHLIVAALLAVAASLGGPPILDAAAQDDGSDPPPSVREVNVSAPARAGTFARGETITVTLFFDERIITSGSPSLSLQIGGETRRATFDRGLPREGTWIRFEYEVQPTDRDDDGISMAADALQLNGGSIRDRNGNDADTSLAAYAISNDPGRKVDGSMRAALVVTGLQRSGPTGPDDTYVLGDTIRIAVVFNRSAFVTGTPTLALTIGRHTRLAGHQTVNDTFYTHVRFDYEVRPDDVDADGLSIDADALRLNGGTIRDEFGTDADLNLGIHAISNHPLLKVDGGGAGERAPPMVDDVDISSRPQTADTYAAGNRIMVQVHLDALVTLEPPSPESVRLELQFGVDTRHAALHDCFGERAGQFRCSGPVSGFLFVYDVEETDMDMDGLSIPEDAIQLVAASVRDLAGRDANLDLGPHAIANDPRHKVDGGLDHPPRILNMWIGSRPRDGDAYRLHETIRVHMNLDENVTIDGEPFLELQIGNASREAAATPDHFIKKVVYFQYAVAEGDQDMNGIGFGADALRFNGGSIRDASGNSIPSNLERFALRDDPDHKVDSSSEHFPMIGAVAVTSRPLRGDTYGPGEEIAVAVEFSEKVQIFHDEAQGGAFELTLHVGSEERLARGTEQFVYEVQASDYDPDGISIREDALRPLAGTEVRDLRDREITDFSLGTHTVTNHPQHKVDGSKAAPVPALPPLLVAALALVLFAAGAARLASRRTLRQRRS